MHTVRRQRKPMNASWEMNWNTSTDDELKQRTIFWFIIELLLQTQNRSLAVDACEQDVMNIHVRNEYTCLWGEIINTQR